DVAPLRERADALRADAQTVMFVAVEDKLAGVIGVADPIKASTREGLDALRGDGVRVVMMTGDHGATAEAVARQLGITEVFAGVLPDQKAETVKRLQAQ